MKNMVSGKKKYFTWFPKGVKAGSKENLLKDEKRPRNVEYFARFRSSFILFDPLFFLWKNQFEKCFSEILALSLEIFCLRPCGHHLAYRYPRKKQDGCLAKRGDLRVMIIMCKDASLLTLPTATVLSRQHLAVLSAAWGKPLAYQKSVKGKPGDCQS